MTVLDSKLIKGALLAGSVVILSGCPLEVTVPSGGTVSVGSGGSCSGNTTCTYPVNDTTFVETFTAVPAAGHVFDRWESNYPGICADPTNPTCVVDITGYQGDQRFEDLVVSSRLGSIKPVFRAAQRVVTGVVSVAPGQPRPNTYTVGEWSVQKLGLGHVRVTVHDVCDPTAGLLVPAPLITPIYGAPSGIVNAHTIAFLCSGTDAQFEVVTTISGNPSDNLDFSFMILDPAYRG